MEIREVSGTVGIGGLLGEARSRAGLSIADLAAQTRIATRYLEAIERDDIDCLPSRCHTIGFVRAFARAVKVDEEPVVTAVRQRLADDELSKASAAAPETARDSMLTPLGYAMQSCTSFVSGGFSLLAGRTPR